MNKRYSIFDEVLDITLYVFLLGIGIYLCCLVSVKLPYEFWTDYLFYEAVFFVIRGTTALIKSILDVFKRIIHQ